MGSGISNLYSGTYGSKIISLTKGNNRIRFPDSLIDIISLRTAGMDLNEHPRKKSLTAKQMKVIKNKIATRTATKKEYKQYDSDRRFAERRKEGVRQFWDQEKSRLKEGLTPTREWSESQQRDILGNVRPKYKGKTLQGHHTYSASKYPQLANRGEVIFPVTFDEHLYGWHGGNFKKSLSGRPIRYRIKHDFRRNNDV